MIKVKGKVKAKFIGKIAKESKKKLPKQLWIPKALVTHVQGPKPVENIRYLIAVALNT